MHRRLALAVLLVAAATVAHAEENRFWRCPSADGKRITYSDQPCSEPGGKGGEIILHPNEIDTSDARARAAQAEIERLQREVQQLKDQQNAAAARRTAPQPRLPSETPACTEAREAYEALLHDRDADRRTMEIRLRSMNAACGISESKTTIQTDNSIYYGTPGWEYMRPPPPPPRPRPHPRPQPPRPCQGSFVKNLATGNFVYKPGYCP